MREWEMGPLYRIGTIAVLASHSIRYLCHLLALMLKTPYSSFHSHLESLSESPHSHLKCHPRPSFQLQSTTKTASIPTIAAFPPFSRQRESNVRQNSNIPAVSNPLFPFRIENTAALCRLVIAFLPLGHGIDRISKIFGSDSKSLWNVTLAPGRVILICY